MAWDPKLPEVANKCGPNAEGSGKRKKGRTLLASLSCFISFLCRSGAAWNRQHGTGVTLSRGRSSAEAKQVKQHSWAAAAAALAAVAVQAISLAAGAVAARVAAGLSHSRSGEADAVCVRVRLSHGRDRCWLQRAVQCGCWWGVGDMQLEEGAVAESGKKRKLASFME